MPHSTLRWFIPTMLEGLTLNGLSKKVETTDQEKVEIGDLNPLSLSVHLLKEQTATLAPH